MSMFTQNRIPMEKYADKVEILQCSKISDKTQPFSYF
jgi:hypothetical protein